jgi:hypothetical protein
MIRTFWTYIACLLKTQELKIPELKTPELKTPDLKPPDPKTPEPDSKDVMPLRIRIPMTVSCEGCSEFKVVRQWERMPSVWTCNDCYSNHSPGGVSAPKIV